VFEVRWFNRTGSGIAEERIEAAAKIAGKGSRQNSHPLINSNVDKKGILTARQEKIPSCKVDKNPLNYQGVSSVDT
jgi:hypothetical protein